MNNKGQVLVIFLLLIPILLVLFTVAVDVGNVMIKEKKCPYCEGSFKKIDVPKILDKYLYVNTDRRYLQ